MKAPSVAQQVRFQLAALRRGGSTFDAAWPIALERVQWPHSTHERRWERCFWSDASVRERWRRAFELLPDPVTEPIVALALDADGD